MLHFMNVLNGRIRFFKLPSLTSDYTDNVPLKSNELLCKTYEMGNRFLEVSQSSLVKTSLVTNKN